MVRITALYLASRCCQGLALLSPQSTTKPCSIMEATLCSSRIAFKVKTRNKMVGRTAPVCGMDGTLFSEDDMFNNATVNGEFRTAANRSLVLVLVHSPAQAVNVEEYRYEHSSWDTDGGHCQTLDNNFNWKLNGCKNF